jgi:hypothetical protein
MKTKMMLLILIVLAVALIGTARPNQTVSAVTGETTVKEETAVIKETAITTKTGAEEVQTAQTEQAEEKKEKKEKAQKEEKKVTIIMKDGKKGKLWCISEIANGKEIVLKHIKDKKDIKYKIISDGVMLITDGKDGGKNCRIYTKGEGKEGEGGHYIIVEKGVETVDIKMLDQDDHYVVIFDKDQEKGHRVKIEILSDNEISGELLEKIKKMTKELQKNLPGSYKLETDFSKTSQCITFVWPLKMDKKTHVEALKHFSAFAKELKKLLSSSKGSKPIKKRITISPKEKDTED